MLLITAVAGLRAQSGGFIRGGAYDRSGLALPGAEVRIQNEATGARQMTACAADGRYASTLVASGQYRVTVRHPGFRTAAKSHVAVEGGTTRALDFLLDLVPLQQEVVVEANHDSDDPNASGLTVSRGAPPSTTPTNGRDLQALYPLMPGAIVTPAPASDGGQLSVTGQRPTTNSYRIDGISGNAGVGIVSTAGPFPGTTLPGMTTIGSTQSLAAREETERVELKPVNFAAERGERPGAQIEVQTRAGSDEFHGSLLGYARPGGLNSRDWFAQRYKLDVPRPSLRGWAASFGGPVIPNHTFFFATREQTYVQDAAVHLLPVPSRAVRASVDGANLAFSNAFPKPFGPALNATEALGASTLRKDARVSSTTVRVDQVIGNKLQLFARAADAPSTSITNDLGTASARLRWQSVTAGANLVEGQVTQQFRANVSHATAISEHAAGAIDDQPAVEQLRREFYQHFPISGSASLFPGSGDYEIYLARAFTAISVSGVGQVVSGPSGYARQTQWEGSYSIAATRGRHEWRAGMDYISIHPSFGFSNSALSLVAPSTAALLAREPFAITVTQPFLTAGTGAGLRTITVFAQDTFRLTDRLTMTYGVREEITPPPVRYGGATGAYFPYAGYWHGPGTDPVEIGQTIAPGQPAWRTSYTQLAPRLGMAYRTKRPGLILRAGFGTFYDTGFGSAIAASQANALGSWQFFPLQGVASLAAGGGQAPLLIAPRAWEWRGSVEKQIRSHGVASLSYLGSSGRSLLRQEATLAPQTSVLETKYFTNRGKSDYQALQMQLAGNLTPQLYALVSYTWGHSIDTGSRDNAVFLTYPGYRDALDRGSSNFDVRHALAMSWQYRVPPARGGHVSLRALVNGWVIGGTLQARSGFPFDVTTVDRSVGLGFDNTGRPDVIPGVPLWLEDSAAAGGRRLNPLAFRPAAYGVTGTLGRNVLTGPGLLQVDLSVRRQWKLARVGTFEGSLTAFNAPNRASFANPVGYVGSALFGQPVSMGSVMLGSGTPTTGQTPIFQAGGARTVELGLKFSF